MSTLGGILIGLAAGGAFAIAGHSKSKKEIDKLKRDEKNLRDELERERRKTSSNPKPDSTPKTDTEKEYVPAEIAFKENLEKFAYLLKGVSKQEITNRQDWTETIITINNEELTDLWMTANKRPDLWMTYLQTFGLQIDLVDSFEATSYHTELYEDASGKVLEMGQMYKVVSSCWIYTDDNNEKSVVCKGLVSKL